MNRQRLAVICVLAVTLFLCAGCGGGGGIENAEEVPSSAFGELVWGEGTWQDNK